MNSRERFIATMNFEPCDRVILWELGYWAGTLRRWYKEGLPQKHGISDDLQSGDGISGEGMPAADKLDPEYKKMFPTKDARDRDVNETLGFDKGLVMLPVNTSLCPAFTPQVLEEREASYIIVDGFGVRKEVSKGAGSVPRFDGWPIENRDDWENFKFRLQPGLANRVPDNWEQLVAGYQNRDFPLIAGFCGEGFFGNLRRFFGEVKLFTTYYDDPQLIKDMNEYFSDLWISLWDEAFRIIKPDVVWFFEDMCYKNGPMISVEMFREFMTPYYKKMNSFLDDHDIKIRMVDTDGDCWKLIPEFIEAGITGLQPFEVGSGMDIVQVREQYPKLQIFGGLDKQAVAKGPEAIDVELSYKLPLIEKGGYVPYLDHLTPPNISWDNFKYYRDKIASYA